MKLFKLLVKPNIIRYVSIGLTLIGSLLMLLSFGNDFVFYELKGNISPAGFLEEANLGLFLNIILWVTVFFPFANAILHFITAPCRVIRNNVLSLIISPLVAFFSFIQMSFSVFLGLVIIFGGLANPIVGNAYFGIFLVVIPILIFGFFGMWKKPHKNRTRTNFLLLITQEHLYIRFFICLYL